MDCSAYMNGETWRFMIEEEKPYKLGRNVTKYAAPKQRSGVVRLAVELPVEEFAAIEEVSRGLNQSMSEYVRAAVRAYREQLHRVSA